MKKKPFEIRFTAGLNDISADARMRSWVLFDLLQDAAGGHADQLGVGLKQLRESNLSWVLSRIRLQMDSFPRYGETVKVTTYPSGFERLFAYRQFLLSSAETGKVFGRAGSAWLTLNTENLRPVSPAKYFAGLPEWEFEGETFFQGENLEKLLPPAEELNTPLFQRISGAWIDYNRHLNNAYYAMFTEDWISQQAAAPVRMTEIQINFNSSTAFGETLAVSGLLTGPGRFFVSGTNQRTGKNAFQASGSWEPAG